MTIRAAHAATIEGLGAGLGEALACGSAVGMPDAVVAGVGDVAGAVPSEDAAHTAAPPMRHATPAAAAIHTRRRVGGFCPSGAGCAAAEFMPSQ